jgi:hypothetical protein
MGSAGALDRDAGPPCVEADQVEGDGGEDVFEVDFADSGVAGVADAGQVGGLADGAFNAGAVAVAVFPSLGGLFGSCVA